MKRIHHHFPSLDSTNECAKRNSHLLELEALTCITADTQTKGRGRMQRTWFSPPHQNIYISFCFFMDKERKDLGNIAQLLAVSVALTLEKLEFHPKIKWPNDLILNGKKVGGILCEIVEQGKKYLVIAGLGLNINMPSSETFRINQPATSLMIEKGTPFDIKNILDLLMKHFEQDLSLFLNEGFTPFLTLLRRQLAHAQGSTIQFNHGENQILGIFDTISDNGSINLKLPNGKIKNFLSGDVVS